MSMCGGVDVWRCGIITTSSPPSAQKSQLIIYGIEVVKVNCFYDEKARIRLRLLRELCRLD